MAPSFIGRIDKSKISEILNGGKKDRQVETEFNI